MKPALTPLTGLSRAESSLLDEVNDLITRGVDRFEEAFAQAARKYMQLSEATREKLRQDPNVKTAHLAASLERVAAKELHPRLALANGRAAAALAKFPYDTQTRAVVELIPVALKDGDHVLKPFDELSQLETSQVFDLTTSEPLIRSIEDQRAWLAAKKLADQRRVRLERSTKLIVRPGKYKIQGNRFLPLKEGYSLRELETIVNEMKRLQG